MNTGLTRRASNAQTIEATKKLDDAKAVTSEGSPDSKIAGRSTPNPILPCPFCGSDPVTFSVGDQGRGLMIECETPGCVNPHVSYYDHATAHKVWNRRSRTKGGA